MFCTSPCSNSLTSSSCSKDNFWIVSEKTLPAFPSLKPERKRIPEECHLRMKFEIGLFSCFLLMSHSFTRSFTHCPAVSHSLCVFSAHNIFIVSSPSSLFHFLPSPSHPISLSLIPPVSLVPQESC